MPEPHEATPRPVDGISEVRHFFRTNDTPVHFVGATPFNLLGLDRWVRHFTYISYYDAWEGAHDQLFTPAHKLYVELQSGEEINNWLLTHPEVRAMMGRRGEAGVHSRIALIFFDAETGRVCDELGYFEVDLLLNMDRNEVYLRELNPRISGATAITNVTAGAYADVPLLLCHLPEFMVEDFHLDIDEFNERWERLTSADLWSQMVIKHTDSSVERIIEAPATGTYLRRRRPTDLPASRAGLAPAAHRGRVLLPTHLRSRGLPLQGIRPGRNRHEGPTADRRRRRRLLPAHHPGPGTSPRTSWPASSPSRSRQPRRLPCRPPAEVGGPR